MTEYYALAAVWPIGTTRVDTFFYVMYAGPEAIGNGKSGYAKFSSRSHDAVIRVFDEAGNLVETHEQTGDFKEP